MKYCAGFMSIDKILVSKKLSENPPKILEHRFQRANSKNVAVVLSRF